jgi:hypothetical protein
LSKFLVSKWYNITPIITNSKAALANPRESGAEFWYVNIDGSSEKLNEWYFPVDTRQYSDPCNSIWVWDVSVERWDQGTHVVKADAQLAFQNRTGSVSRKDRSASAAQSGNPVIFHMPCVLLPCCRVNY